jgi:O-antigen ligase
MVDLTSSIRPIKYLTAQYSTLWPKLIIISAMIALSIVLGMKGSTQHVWAIFILLGGIVAILAFLRWPSLGLILAYVGGVFIPNIGAGGLNIAVVLIGLLLILWLMDMFAVKREVQLVPSRTLWPALLFIVIATISFGFGQLPWFTYVLPASIDAQIGGYLIYILSFGAFLLAANQIQDIRWLKWLVWIFLFVSCLYVLGTQIPGYGQTFRNLFQRIGSVAWIWMVALSLSQGLYNKDLKPLWRILLIAFTLLVLCVAFFIRFDDKSGWIPGMITAFVILSIRSWRSAMVVVIVGALIFWSNSSLIFETEEYSLSTRIDAWVIMAEIIKANPLFGLGFSNYYWITPLFPIRGWEVEFNSHNNYVDIIAQTGFVGLACYWWFFIQISLVCVKLSQIVPEGFPRAYTYSAIGGIAGMLVTGMFGDWVLPFVYNIGMNGFRGSLPGWLFLGGLVFLEKKYRYQSTIE